MPDRGGPIMAQPRLVPILYADDPDPDGVVAYLGWLVGSDWITQVGGEYGVGRGSVLSVVHRASAAPDMLDDAQIVDDLFADLDSGVVPAPEDADYGQVLYMVYMPEHTLTNQGTTSESCTDFGGYHSSARRNGREILYAVLSTCPGFFTGLTGVESRELISSHEVIEAATDPSPGNQPAFQLPYGPSGWLELGAEVADLCNRDGSDLYIVEDGHRAVRSWSNAAATRGDPCVPPSASRRPYINVTADRTFARVAAGARATFSLTGYSSAKVADWQVSADASGLDLPTLTLDTDLMNAGKTIHLEVDVPAGAADQDVSILVFSSTGPAEYTFIPLSIAVGDPCATSTACGDCTLREGCGWCGASATCENLEGATCGASLALWSGDCPGFCAGFDDTCLDCASQFGCAWCASATGTKCLDMGRDFSEPAEGTCPYVDWTPEPSDCPGP